MRYTPSKKQREYRAWMFGQGAIALLFALENLDQFSEYFTAEAKLYNKVDDDYIVDKVKLKIGMEEAIDFLNNGAGLV